MRLAALLVAAGAVAAAQSPEIEFFERRIRPVLVERCEVCHSSRLEEPMGNLRVDSREGLLAGGASGPALMPGSPDRSLMIKALSYLDPVLKMPPTGKLPDRVVEDFRTWIAAGAADPRGAPVEAVSEASGEPSGPGTPIEKGRRWWAFQALEERVAPPFPIRTGRDGRSTPSSWPGSRSTACGRPLKRTDGPLFAGPTWI